MSFHVKRTIVLWSERDERGDKKGAMKTHVNGITIHYRLDGPEGAPLLTMSHSLATHLGLWEPQVRVMGERFRLLRYDTRGHGGSDAPDGPYTLEGLASDIHALLLDLGVERTHFMGISMGGMIGQVMALSYPELLQSLVLCDTTSRVPPEASPVWEERIRSALREGMEPHVEPTIERWFTAPFRRERPDVVEPVREMIRATPPKGYAGCCAAIRELDVTDRLGGLDLPALILVGEDDPGTPVAESVAMHERIPRSRLAVLKSAAHLSNQEQPDAFNRQVMAFLNAV